MLAAISPWPDTRSWRFGTVRSDGIDSGGGSGEDRVVWTLKRNCSLSPRQSMAFFASLCVVSLGIALLFWVHGARMVMVFAWVELTAVGVALLCYARHAGDRESIVLRPGSLVVECHTGESLERHEFSPGRVQVETPRNGRSLIELRCQGQSVRVGRHVRPEWRRGLAEELRAALQTVRSTQGGGEVARR